MGEARPPGKNRRDLTVRETQVLIAIADGKTNEQIAALLGCGRETVKTHAVTIYQKLNASGRSHAVAIGFRDGTLS